MRYLDIKEDVRCPICKGKNIIRKGRGETKFGSKQIYLCRDCGRRFANRKLSYKTYGPKVITNAITIILAIHWKRRQGWLIEDSRLRFPKVLSTAG